MKISIITVGKIKEKYLKVAIAEYSKRLSKYCKLEIIEDCRMRKHRMRSEIDEMPSAQKR